MKESFEATMKKSRLSRVNGGEAFGSTWSLWIGENESGRVAAKGTFPSAMDKKRNQFWVTFEPAKESFIPQAVLTHLLAKAEATSVGSGDTLDLKLPYEQNLMKCFVQFTFRIRITGGALVRNTAEFSCPVTDK